MEKLYIIKIGGNVIDNSEKLSEFIKKFSAINGKKILVHGGGKLATDMAEKMGINQQLIEGRRITDAETLKIVTMVYAGYINKNIVASLQAADCNSIGFSGADANIILAEKRGEKSSIGLKGVDYGFVGDIVKINIEFLQNLLSQNISPVVCPITHDGKGILLNTNADTIAQEFAKSLCGHYEVTLIYCFEKFGVLLNANDENSRIDILKNSDFEKLKNEGIISAGMIPKLDNAFAALRHGVQNIQIGHADNLEQLIFHKSGTSIVYE